MNLIIYFLSFISIYYQSVLNVDDYGAISSITLPIVAEHNSGVIEYLAEYANKTYEMTGQQSIIYIPPNDYYVSAIDINNIDYLRFQIDGNLIANDNIDNWPLDENDNKKNIFTFTNTDNLYMTGNGKIDGQGYRWWWDAILSATGKTEDNRPNMINVHESQNIKFTNLRFENSPRYHLRLDDIDGIMIDNITIFVDPMSPKGLNHHIPIFPLNTDGIDPSATNVIIRNSNITCFDDAIAIKPCHGNYHYCKCASNITIHDTIIYNSLGATIGSVPPNKHHSCVDNIIFDNITLIDPIKGIYIKTNPGTEGTGQITNVIYNNITIDNPIWEAIYIGPQQQKQPDGTGPGCMNYPKDDCETQPLVTIRNITLRNVNITNSHTDYAGIMRCNETNPCTNFTMDNVINHQHSETNSYDYICENIDIMVINSNPDPKCIIT